MTAGHEQASEPLTEALRRAQQAEAEIMRLRAGEEPHADPHTNPTPGQWIRHWNRATPEKRLDMARHIQDAMARSGHCYMGDHDALLEARRDEIARLRREVEEQTEAKEVYIRLTNSARAARDRLATALQEVLTVFDTVTITGDSAPIGHLAPRPVHPDDYARWRAALGEQSAQRARDRHAAEAHNTEESPDVRA